MPATHRRCCRSRFACAHHTCKTCSFGLRAPSNAVLKCCGHNAKLAQASVIEAGESLLLRVDVADIDATIQAPRLLAAMSAGQGRALVCLPSGYLMSAFACKRVLLHLLRVEVLHLTFE